MYWVLTIVFNYYYFNSKLKLNVVRSEVVGKEKFSSISLLFSRNIFVIIFKKETCCIGFKNWNNKRLFYYLNRTVYI